MKKKILLFISILILSLTSCGIINVDENNPTANQESTNQTEQATSPTEGTTPETQDSKPSEDKPIESEPEGDIDDLLKHLANIKKEKKLTIIEDTSITLKDGSTDSARRISNVDLNKSYARASITHGEAKGYVHKENSTYYYRLNDRSDRLELRASGDAFEITGLSELFNYTEFRIKGYEAKATLSGQIVQSLKTAFDNVNLDLERDFVPNPSILKVNIKFNKEKIENITLDMNLIFSSYAKSVTKVVSFSHNDFEYEELDLSSGTKYYTNTAATLDTYVIEMVREYADAIYIKSGDFDMLIDAGQYEDGKNVKAMLDEHVTDGVLEVLMVTHGHADHLGGINAGCLEGLDIGILIDYGYHGNDDRYEMLREEPDIDYFSAYDCVTGSNGAYKIFNFSDNLSLEILNTGQYIPYGGNPPENENDPSVTAKLTFGKNTYLYTGDLSGDLYEKSLRYEDIDDITVYKAAHHGSASHNSNTQSFLNRINPEICVVSAAIKDSIGLTEQYHPSRTFVSRILRAPRISKNKNLYYNGTMGTIHLIDDGNNTPAVRGLGAKKGYYIDNKLVTGEENKKFIDTLFYKRLY